MENREGQMKLKFRKFYFILLSLNCAFLAGQNDSIYISHIDQFSTIKEDTVRVLVIDISMPKRFNYNLYFPVVTESLYFKKPNKTPKYSYLFYEKIIELRLLEVNGKMAELIPEILDICKRLDKLLVSNTKLSRIWNFTLYLSDKNLSELHFKNLKIKENCKMYERLFFGGDLTVDTLFFEFNERVKAHKVNRVKYIFKAKGCYINGTLYEPYSNSQLFDKKNRLRL